MGGRPRGLREDRRVFWALVGAGLGSEAAAQRVGVSGALGRRWFREAGGMAPLTLGPASGRFLQLTEREEIAVLLAAGHGVREIARRLERAPSTISREVRRNTRRTFAVPPRAARPGKGRWRATPAPYRAVRAQLRADRMARRPKPAKLLLNAGLRGIVQAGLERGWSPEQISATLKARFPGWAEMQVSHETIYQSLYVQSRGGLRRELTRCLRTGRALRKPRARADERRGRIPGMVMISQRPAEAADRAVPGHWEGDLIIGRNSRSAIGTLVERSTRYCLLLYLPGKHGAEQVQQAMLAAITQIPDHLWRSLAWDQGVEMSRHREISMATGIPIYFCDPASPWQRGTNENTNGLLRQYFPKGLDLSVFDADHLDAVATQLNGRPRKTLGWQTPAERLNELLSYPYNKPRVATTT
jgi:transposase, IS30 family